MTLVSNDHNKALPAQPLHDTLEDHAADDKPRLVANGKGDDFLTLTMHDPLYWRSCGLHYTLDGTDPTEQSPVYTTPLRLSASATVKAKSILSPTQCSQTTELGLSINYIVPPTVKSATAFSVHP